MDNKNAAPERTMSPDYRRGLQVARASVERPDDFMPSARVIAKALLEAETVIAAATQPMQTRSMSLDELSAEVLRINGLQPVPSEGGSIQGVPEVWPDDVLTDMDNAWRNATDVRRVGHYETLMAVAAAAIRGLARHRTPEVAAPYGAEGLVSALQVADIRFDGLREMLLARQDKSLLGPIQHTSKSQGEIKLALAVYRQALAQSPTTQAGGADRVKASISASLSASTLRTIPPPRYGTCKLNAVCPRPPTRTIT